MGYPLSIATSDSLLMLYCLKTSESLRPVAWNLHAPRMIGTVVVGRTTTPYECQVAFSPDGW